MAYLLDVNMLIAVIDKDHERHDIARDWFRKRTGEGWATCPITENGFVRIFSHSAYPGTPTTTGEALALLESLKRYRGHQFWPDSITVTSPNLANAIPNGSHKDITDLYLLELASSKEGKLATLDSRLKFDLLASGQRAIEIIA